jgi:Tfp pilus assembly protein PilF
MSRIKFSLLLGSVLLLSTACSQIATPSKPLAQSSKPGVAPSTEPAQIGSEASFPKQLMAANQAHFSAAKHLMQQQSFSQAAVLLQNIINSEADFAGVWYNLAVCQWQLQQLSQAKHSLQQALVATPKHSASHNLLGILAREQGEFGQAEQHWLQAVAISDAAVAHKNLGILYELYLAQLTKAYWHYQRYFALSQDPQATLWLTLLERQLVAKGITPPEESL